MLNAVRRSWTLAPGPASVAAPATTTRTVRPRRPTNQSHPPSCHGIRPITTTSSLFNGLYIPRKQSPGPQQHSKLNTGRRLKTRSMSAATNTTTTALTVYTPPEETTKSEDSTTITPPPPEEIEETEEPEPTIIILPAPPEPSPYRKLAKRPYVSSWRKRKVKWYPPPPKPKEKTIYEEFDLPRDPLWAAIKYTAVNPTTTRVVNYLLGGGNIYQKRLEKKIKDEEERKAVIEASVRTDYRLLMLPGDPREDKKSKEIYDVWAEGEKTKKTVKQLREMSGVLAGYYWALLKDKFLFIYTIYGLPYLGYHLYWDFLCT